MTRISEVDVRLPCGSDSRRRHHLAHSQTCDRCGIPTEPTAEVRLLRAIRTQQATVIPLHPHLDASVRRHPAGRRLP